MINRPRPPFAFAAIALVAVVSVLALPSAASASAPGALTLDVYSSGAATATVEGTVNPEGEATQYQAQYGPASSDWCTSAGASGSPADTTGLTSLGSTDPGNHVVSVDLTTDLTEGAGFCAQLIATNGSGEADGGQVTWTQGAPFADTFDANSTGLTTATIDGDVNPGDQSTSYVVMYDLDSTEWCTTSGASGAPTGATTPQMLPDTDGTFHDVSIELTGLVPGNRYCAEVVASNSLGTTPIDDGDQAFWTQPTPPPPPPQYPLTVTVTGQTGILGPGRGMGTVTSSPAGIDCAAGNTCSADFTSGTQVTLTATPSAGSTFGGWRGNPACLQSTVCVITVSGDTPTIGADFFPSPPARYALSVVMGGDGFGTVTSSPSGIDCDNTGTAGAVTCSYTFTGPVTLSATAVDSTFSGWSGGGCSGLGSCTVTLTSDTTVTANFDGNQPLQTLPTKCVVPKVKRKSLPTAKRAIVSHHCSVGKITKVKSTKKNRGHVVSQSPKPGTHLRKGSKVALKVGK